MTGDLISAMAIAMQTLLHTMVTPPNVSRETFLLYADYVALLLKWNAKINLIGPTTEADIWSRHIEDSAQLVPLIPASAKNLIDLGSGGGLPGLVAKFQQAGLGNVIASWLSAGPNQAISGEQLSQVLGSGPLSQIAAQLGVGPGAAAGQLAQVLPGLVDHLSPQGQAPHGGFGDTRDLLGLLGDLLKK